MGTIRLLFALSILIYHSGQIFGYNVTNRTVSVLSFFIISGFYMALILDKKYTGKKHILLFWSNRLLRIFPLYWAILLITFIFTMLKLVLHVGTDDNAIVHYINWSPHTSPVIFGLNLLNYIFRNITLLISVDYLRINDSTPGYLLVQQAWTLQIELLFYLLAPFLAQLSKKLFLAVSLIYIIGFFCFIAPFHLLQKNLLYGFLSNLIFFLLGMISYRFLYKHFQSNKLHPQLPRLVFLIFLIYLLFYNVIPFKYSLPLLNVTDPLYYIILICSLPLIFLQTSSSIIDSFIGKLSYPVYIMHFFVVKLFSNVFFFKQDSNLKTMLVIVATLCVSYLAIKFIENPIDRYRQKRIASLKLTS